MNCSGRRATVRKKMRLFFLFFFFHILFVIPSENYLVIAGGRAPEEPPKIEREDWCVNGTATRTTGECICRWAHKDACQGHACRYEYGLAFHHHTCLDCACQAKPKSVGAGVGNNLRVHAETPIVKRLATLKLLFDSGMIDADDFKSRKREILLDV